MFKLFVLACALFGVAKAQAILAAPAAINTGSSAQFRTQDNVGNYAFGYNEDHATGGTFRRESGNALGQVIGSYGLRDADGRIRTVNYVADGLGFRANIQSNEPGVEPKDPAAVAINKPAVLAAPVAPIVAAPAPLAAPVVAAAPAHYAVAPAPAIATTSYQTTVTNHAVPAPLVAAAAAPAPLVAAAPAPLVAHSAPQITNAYVHPAAFGYTLGLPPTFGYTIRK